MLCCHEGNTQCKERCLQTMTNMFSPNRLVLNIIRSLDIFPLHWNQFGLQSGTESEISQYKSCTTRTLKAQEKLRSHQKELNRSLRNAYYSSCKDAGIHIARRPPNDFKRTRGWGQPYSFIFNICTSFKLGSQSKRQKRRPQVSQKWKWSTMKTRKMREKKSRLENLELLIT